MSRDFRPDFSTPDPHEPLDPFLENLRLPPVIDLPVDYAPKPAHVTRYVLSPADLIDNSVGQYVPLPACRCAENAEHEHGCSGPSYRLALVGGETMLWTRPPGDGDSWYTPKDCTVSSWQTMDPRTYVYEISDPWAASELWEAPPAWEYA